jgi:hypothetical protein
MTTDFYDTVFCSFRNLLICNLRINNGNLRICGLTPFSNFSNLLITKSGISPRVCGFACPPLTLGPCILYSGPRYFILEGISKLGPKYIF